MCINSKVHKLNFGEGAIIRQEYTRLYIAFGSLRIITFGSSLLSSPRKMMCQVHQLIGFVTPPPLISLRDRYKVLPRGKDSDLDHYIQIIRSMHFSGSFQFLEFFGLRLLCGLLLSTSPLTIAFALRDCGVFNFLIC